MRLSDFQCLSIMVENDAEFNSTCKIDDKPPTGKYLLFIEKPNWADKSFKHIDSVVAIITTEELKSKFSSMNIGVAISENPKESFLKICNSIVPKYKDKITSVGSNCGISKTVEIPDYGVEIGNNVIIEDQVTIHAGVKIGNDCIIGRGTVLGCSNYERCFDSNGTFLRSRHNGSLKIGNGVTINENVMIDKAFFDWDSTEIADNCYIGRGSDISHGCKIGENSIIAHQVCICGNVIIGERVKVSVGAVLSNRIKIGDNAIVSLGSVVNKDVPSNSRVTGNFAIPHKKLINNLKKIISDQ